MAENSSIFSNLVNKILGRAPQDQAARTDSTTQAHTGALASAAVLSALSGQPALATEIPNDHTPVIAISGGSADSKSVAAAVAMVRAQGAEPLVITSHSGRDASADMRKVDGLVVLGNDYDIAPESYGQQPNPHTLSENDPALIQKMEAQKGRPLTDSEHKTIANLPARAAYENSAIKYAISNKIPLTTICAGDQRLNVAMGGTLHQHIPDLIGNTNHMQTEAPYVPVLPVSIDPNSKLGKLGQGIRNFYAPQPGAQTAAPLVLMENSFHHQAVDKVAPGFVASAHYADSFTGADGQKHMLVGGIEPAPKGPYANQFIIGVQWHPEFGASPLGPRIFSGLADAAREHAATRQATADRPIWLNQLLNERAPQEQLGTKQDATLPQEHLLKNTGNGAGQSR